jgi:5-methyltetrahydrofolate--homocysteine methyltransferase
MVGRATWQWFSARGDGDALQLFANGDATPTVQWTLPRARGGGVGLPDYVHPEQDTVGLLAVTAGEGIREWSTELKDAGQYLKSHIVQALALETAEALAEWLHSRMRGMWGFPDDPGATMLDRFKAKYQGKRYSPGYPACPDLGMQQGIWKLLKPQDIGIDLTDGDMMDPEASVSAIVLHHPDAKYFATEESAIG